MKKNQLKVLIKEIVTTSLKEMGNNRVKYLAVAGWEQDPSNEMVIYFNDVLLPDQRRVDISVTMSGSWNDGSFGYEYGSMKGVHKYPLQFEPENSQVTYAQDHNTGQQLPIDNFIIEAGEALFDDYAQEIIDRMEPPEG